MKQVMAILLKGPLLVILPVKSGKQITVKVSFTGNFMTAKIGDRGGVYYGPRPYRPPGGRWPINQNIINI